MSSFIDIDMLMHYGQITGMDCSNSYVEIPT